jgi:hypothetical protein
VCHQTDPAAIVHYELQGLPQAMLLIRFHSNLRLMWPYSERVTGEILYDWAPAWNAVVIRDRSGDLVTIAGANKKPISTWKSSIMSSSRWLYLTTLTGW